MTEIRAYAAGGYTEQRANELESHLLACPQCETLLDGLDDPSDGLIQALTSLPASADDEAEYRQLREAAMVAPVELSEAAAATALLERASRLASPALGPLPYELGNYELLACIGRGASGAVYRALHLKLDQTVAVKVLDASRSFAADSFLQEMKTIGSLAHPHIVRATDAGESNGLHYLVMEYVDGIDAARLLFRNGPLRVADACEIVRQAALGLQFVHEQSLVHRDIKPSNLLVTSSGQVKLLDLGIAMRSDATAGPKADNEADIGENTGENTEENTAANTAAGGGPVAPQRPNDSDRAKPQGTFDYMAPEQWTDPAAVDPRTDLFSLGCTLFRLLTGKVPPKPYTAASATDVEVPRAIDRLLQQLLAAAPEHRPQSIDAVIDALPPHARGADLTALIAGVSTPGATCVAPPNAKPRWLDHAPISRRTALVAMTATSAAALLLSRLRSGWGPQLRRIEWRPLTPVMPAILLAAGDPDSVTYASDDQGAIQIASDDLALIHLGRPVTGLFTLQVGLLSGSEPQGGLFFQGRIDYTPGGHVLRFQTVELQPQDPSLGTAAQRRLLWSQWTAERNDDRISMQQTSLAEVDVELEANPHGQQLQIKCGEQGMPEITWNGKQLHESMWQLSAEARALQRMSVSQRPTAFLGRLGLLNSQGSTTFIEPRLAYL